MFLKLFSIVYRYQTVCLLPYCSTFRPTSLRCPVDGDIISQEGSFRDKCCEREILDLKCFCRHKDRNCDWKGELRYLKVSILVLTSMWGYLLLMIYS